MTSEHLATFAREARSFTQWALGRDGSAITPIITLHRILSLYQAALKLPQPWSDALSAVSAEPEVPQDEISLVNARVATLPFQFYWEAYNPFEIPQPATVGGDLADDICDIYRDVASGVILYDSGKIDEALWAWGFYFRIHWGEHATSAIRVLHCHLSQESPNELSSNA